MVWSPFSLMRRKSSTQQGHGISLGFPNKLTEQVLKAMLSSQYLTPEYGRSLTASKIKDLVHRLANGRAFARAYPISLATSKS